MKGFFENERTPAYLAIDRGSRKGQTDQAG
jgi:hypothetical protein